MIHIEISLQILISWTEEGSPVVLLATSRVCMNGPLETVITDPQDGEMPFFSKRDFSIGVLALISHWRWIKQRFLMEKYVLGNHSFEFTEELNVQQNHKWIIYILKIKAWSWKLLDSPDNFFGGWDYVFHNVESAKGPAFYSTVKFLINALVSFESVSWPF